MYYVNRLIEGIKMKLEFDSRDGTWHYAKRTNDGCIFYSQDFSSKEEAEYALKAGMLVNVI